MRILLLVFLCFFGVAHVTLAESPSPLGEAKSKKAGAQETFSAVCQMSFDASGRAKAVMTKSTGSKALDDFVTQDATRIFRGLRNVSLPYYVECKVVEVMTSRGKSKVRVVTPRPPYPAQARTRNEQGSGVVRAFFDGSGRVISTEIIRSTGSKILDSNTSNYALANWRSTGGAKITVDLPVEYRLVHSRGPLIRVGG